MKIDFCIPVKDKEIWRLRNCINSIKSDVTGEIYVIDYGSSKPIKLKMKGVEVIRYDKNKYFNKSHALNLGIRRCKSDYIATIDCDTLLCDGFLDKVKDHLIGDVLVISRNLRRVKKEYLKNPFEIMWKYGTSWAKSGIWANHAVGGVQIFSKKWMHKIHGYNENLVLMGGMDTRVFEQAIMDSIPVIDINLPIIHQEHDKIKNEQFESMTKNIKFDIIARKAEYLERLKKTYKIKNYGSWGGEFANQNKFIGDTNKREKRLSIEHKKYREAFVEAVRNKKNFFTFKGQTVEING